MERSSDIDSSAFKNRCVFVWNNAFPTDTMQKHVWKYVVDNIYHGCKYSYIVSYLLYTCYILSLCELNNTFSHHYGLDRDVIIDESIVGFKGRNSLVQYMPAKKAHRWGPKFFLLAESDTGYIHQMRLYTGMSIGYHRPVLFMS
jgi:hypothetical protein